MKRIVIVTILIVIYVCLVCCTATQRRAAETAAVSTGVDALNGANNQQLEIDGAKGALKVIETP